MENYTCADIPTAVRAKMHMYGASVRPGVGHQAAKDAMDGGKKKGKGAKEKGAQQQAARNPPIAEHPEKDRFGDLKLVQSAYKTQRKWFPVGELNESRDGQYVWIRGRVHTVRAKGKSCFVVLRRGMFTVQLVLFEGENCPRDMVKYASKIPPESVIDVYGKVCKLQTPTQTTQSTVEVAVEKIFGISIADALPFQMTDAVRPEAKEGEEASEDGAIHVGTEIRLDNRCIDMRTPASHAIMRLNSAVCTYFRQFLLKLKFVEIHTPKITPGVSEGGAAVFRLEYFGRPACLAQSPQLYKQMASVAGDLFRVFEIAPVFRAEDSNTHRHLCEFTGLDFEMEISEHYHEVLFVLWDLFVSIFDNINEHCQEELRAIKQQYPFEDLKYPKEPCILGFKEAVAMLREAGVKRGDYDDFSTTEEKTLGKLVKQKYGTDFYIVDQYPKSVRPFYTMPSAIDPNYSNSYDVFLRGEEITSGAQRVHDVVFLAQRATECGIPLDNIEGYLHAFKHGIPPHGGAGVGMERVTMLFCGLNNIRKVSMFPRDPKRLVP